MFPEITYCISGNIFFRYSLKSYFVFYFCEDDRAGLSDE